MDKLEGKSFCVFDEKGFGHCGELTPESQERICFLFKPKPDEMSDNWDGEHCQKCGRAYRLAWLADEELWARVVQGKYNLLDIECFLSMAGKRGVNVSLNQITTSGIAMEVSNE